MNKLTHKNEIQEGSAATPKGRGRGCLIGLGRLVILIVALLLAGAIYEPLAEAADAKAYPPPGQMVDVGGYRLHINCTGNGSPTVVIDAGWGDWSTTWADGYKRFDGVIEIVEEEAKWVRQIFAWYNQHIPLMEIRRRLIESNAPQKGGPTPRRIEMEQEYYSGYIESSERICTRLEGTIQGGRNFYNSRPAHYRHGNL